MPLSRTSLPHRVPQEMWDRYLDALSDRDQASKLIRRYTGKWVEAQERIIEMEEFLQRGGK